MNYNVVDNTAVDEAKNRKFAEFFKGFWKNASSKQKIEHVVLLPLWIYSRLAGELYYGLKNKYQTKDHTRIEVDFLPNNTYMVKVKDVDYKFNDKDGNLVKPYMNTLGKYYFSNEDDYNYFMDSYKFHKANIYSKEIDGKNCSIYKRDDLQQYIVTSLPKDIDPAKYHLTLDKNGNYVLPIMKKKNKAEDEVINRLMSDLERYNASVKTDDKKINERVNEKDNQKINERTIDINRNEINNTKSLNINNIFGDLNKTADKFNTNTYQKTNSKQPKTKTKMPTRTISKVEVFRTR